MSNLAVNPNPFPLNPAAEQQSEWGYGQLFSILIRRKWWVISIFLGTMATTVFLTNRATVIYQSDTQLLIESSYSTKKGSDSVIEPTVELDIATQLNVLRSSEILQRAVDQLRVDYPTISAQEIRASLRVQPIYAQNQGGKTNIQTKLLSASYNSSDAIKTQRVLDAVLKVYQDYNLEQQDKRIKQGLKTINRQLPPARSGLIESEKALEAFRKAHNVIDPQKESESTAAALSRITEERQSLQAKIAQDAESLNTAQQQLSLSPETANVSNALNNSSTIDSLRKQVQESELQVSSLRQELAPQHPMLLDAEQKLTEIQQLLDREISRVTGNSNVAVVAPGQISTTDIQLIQTITTLEQAIASNKAKDASLAQTEQQLSQELKRYPTLIAQYTRLQPEVLARRGTLEKLLDQKEDLSLEIAKGGINWEVVEPPQPGLPVESRC
ncbi:MAG: GumC family protein [Acaryochloridaceae cyanobacterium RL_2_7]|nr:GumC family protein [Acaryochloridaceae cyanobacterium RL_2_7]